MPTRTVSVGLTACLIVASYQAFYHVGFNQGCKVWDYSKALEKVKVKNYPRERERDGVLAYAKKQRHAKLLEKIRNSIGLSVSELEELEEYETEIDMSKTKPIPGKTKIASVEQRYELFAREYVKNSFNATQAAIRAGYSKKTADRQASRLLRIDEVQIKIERQKAKAVKTADLSLASVLEETKKLAFSNIGDYIEFSSTGVKLNDSSALSRDELSCIIEVSEHAVTKKRKSLKFKLHDKARALNTLLEYFKDMPGTGPEEQKVIRLPLTVQIKK